MHHHLLTKLLKYAGISSVPARRHDKIIFNPFHVSIGIFGILFPWIAIVGFVAKLTTLCAFLLVSAGLVILGQWFIETTIMNLAEEEKRLLYLPAGYMVVCGVTALAVRSGISASAVFWTITALAVLGMGRLLVQRSIKKDAAVPGARSLAVLSLIIALIYYLPGAMWDAVYLPDGSYNWLHVDTQYFTAIAASVKSSVGVPKAPGVGLLDLSYHFGPYAVAGALSSAIDIPIGDSLVRVFRPIALLSLIFASYATGRFIGRGVGQEAAGGILAVAGLFFYGSIFSLFASPSTSSLVKGAILFDLPHVAVPGNGGPFAHLILGHSQVHGLSGLLVLVLIMLAKLQTQEKRYFNMDSSTLGPAIIFPTSIILGCAVLGLYILLLSWYGARYKQTWLTLGIAIGAAIFSVWAMGYINILASEHAEFSSVQLLQEKLFVVFVWFYIGLSVRLYAFTKITNPLRDAVSATLLILLFGFLAFSIFCRASDSRYGFLYAQGILSVFSFAWLSSPLRAAIDKNWPEVRSSVTGLMRIVFISSMVFLVPAAALYLLPSVLDSDTLFYSISVSRTLKCSLILIMLATVGVILMNNKKYFRYVIAVLVASVFLVGFTAWITDWINYGLGRLKMNVTISEGEVQGLEVLRTISSKGDLICTNKHTLTGYNYGLGRSNAYGALSERTVLIEGWGYAVLKNPDWFEKVLSENEMIFTSTQPRLVKSIIDKYKIKYIVAKPGTSLAIESNLPKWLTEIQDTGNIKVYALAREHL